MLRGEIVLVRGDLITSWTWEVLKNSNAEFRD